MTDDDDVYDDSRFNPVDDDYDYSDTSDWTAELGETDVVLNPDSKTEKRFHLKEPATDADVERVRTSLLEADRFQLVTILVQESSMTEKRWHHDLTSDEREALYDLCCEFIHADQLVVGDQVIQDAKENRHSNR